MEIQEKHAGGRPPIYDGNNEEDIKKVKELCKTYFDSLKPFQPPTVSGLTLHLGFDCKQTLYNYSSKEQFLDPIKKAITRIELYHEEAVAGGDKCVGNIFVLKNFGWKDTISTEHSGEIKGGNTYDLSKLPTAALEALANAANDTSKD